MILATALVSGMTAMVFGMNAHSEQTVPVLPEEVKNVKVIAAMKAAWQRSRDGSLGLEAAFRLDGTQSEYNIVAEPSTNQYHRHGVSFIPGVTFALFHVHPITTDPAPSRGDRRFADKYKIRIYTMHAYGLYQYDPVTKRTIKLRNGLEWLKPSK